MLNEKGKDGQEENAFSTFNIDRDKSKVKHRGPSGRRDAISRTGAGAQRGTERRGADRGQQPSPGWPAASE